MNFYHFKIKKQKKYFKLLNKILKHKKKNEIRTRDLLVIKTLK